MIYHHLNLLSARLEQIHLIATHSMLILDIMTIIAVLKLLTIRTVMRRMVV